MYAQIKLKYVWNEKLSIVLLYKNIVWPLAGICYNCLQDLSRVKKIIDL